MNSTVPVGLLPVTTAPAVNDVPKVVALGTPDRIVVVPLRLPAVTVMTYGAVVE